MLFDRLIDQVLIANGLEPSQNKAVDPSTLIDLSPQGIAGIESSYGDVGALSDIFEKVVWVFRCISIIATNIASLPIRVYQVDNKGNKVDISHLPEFQILYKPNKWQTTYDFWMESICRLELQGELFWELESPTPGGKISAMYADWRSEQIEIQKSKEEYIVGYVRMVDGKKHTYTADQVFFMKYFNPSTIWRGMSPLRAARDVLILELNAVKCNKNFFAQGMKLDGVLKIPAQSPTDEEIKRAREKFAELYQGTDKMHRLGVLWGGAEFTPLQSMTLRDAEFTTLRGMNREEIAATFGVPLEVLGVGKKTYENWKEARKSFWQETLLPKLLKIYSLINDMFLGRITNRSDVLIEPDLEDVEALKEDQDSLSKRYFLGFDKAAVTPNEIRSNVFGLDKMDDPAMDQTYIPMTVVPMSGAGEEQAGYSKKKDTVEEILQRLEQKSGKP